MSFSFSGCCVLLLPSGHLLLLFFLFLTLRLLRLLLDVFCYWFLRENHFRQLAEVLRSDLIELFVSQLGLLKLFILGKLVLVHSGVANCEGLALADVLLSTLLLCFNAAISNDPLHGLTGLHRQLQRLYKLHRVRREQWPE